MKMLLFPSPKDWLQAFKTFYRREYQLEKETSVVIRRRIDEKFVQRKILLKTAGSLNIRNVYGNKKDAGKGKTIYYICYQSGKHSLHSNPIDRT